MGLFIKILELTGQREQAQSQVDRELVIASELVEKARQCLDSMNGILPGRPSVGDYRSLEIAARDFRAMARGLHRQSKRLDRAVNALSESGRAVRDRLDRE